MVQARVTQKEGFSKRRIERNIYNGDEDRYLSAGTKSPDDVRMPSELSDRWKPPGH